MGRVWKSERIEKILISIFCVWLGLEKLRNGNLFCLTREKGERMKKVIYINWLICSYLKFKKKEEVKNKKKKKKKKVIRPNLLKQKSCPSKILLKTQSPPVK